MFTKVNAKALCCRSVAQKGAGLSLGFHPPPVKATRYTHRARLQIVPRGTFLELPTGRLPRAQCIGHHQLFHVEQL
jgi:hypothetical protein